MNNQEAIRLIRKLFTMCEFTDAYGDPIDSDAYYEAVDMAISALQAQDSPKPIAESVQNVQNEDLISRKAAIEAFMTATSDGDKADWCKWVLERLPSAQPKKRTEERTETHACDLISRQAAIEAILAVTGNSSVRELYEHVQEHGLSEMWSGGVNAAIDIIIAVPSAHPETDVLAWMLAYHTKSFELHGRYFPHEVIGWLVNDFSKDFIAERQKE